MWFVNSWLVSIFFGFSWPAMAQSPGYVKAAAALLACPQPITTATECQAAVGALGGRWNGERHWSDRCFGCLYITTAVGSDMNFNTNQKRWTIVSGTRQMYCARLSRTRPPGLGSCGVCPGWLRWLRTRSSGGWSARSPPSPLTRHCRRWRSCTGPVGAMHCRTRLLHDEEDAGAPPPLE